MSSGENLLAEEGDSVFHDVVEYQDDRPTPNYPATATLLSLPREIRDKIYRYTLTSPTGYIHLLFLSSRNPEATNDKTMDERGSFSIPYGRLSKPNSQGTVSPALLQTCTQIRVEAFSILFASNIVVFPSSVEESESLKVAAALSSYGDKIRHVWIDSCFATADSLEHVEAQPKMFQRWADDVNREGPLESVTLSFTHDTETFCKLAVDSKYPDGPFSRAMELLEDDRLRWAEQMTKTRSSKVVRKLEISGIYYECKNLPQSFEAAVVKMRDVFGGELWFDPGWCAPALCWQDGEEVWPLFAENSEYAYDNWIRAQSST